MNFGKMREFFVHSIPRKKNLLHFVHRYNGFGEILRIFFSSGELMHLQEVVFGDLIFDRVNEL